MTGDQGSPVRDYGGWRPSRPVGMWGLGSGGTFAVLGIAVLVVTLAAVDVRALAYAGPVVVVGGALGLAKSDGEPVLAMAIRRSRWWYASTRGYTRYRLLAAVVRPEGLVLPGALAPAELLSVDDGSGRRCGMVWDRRTGLLTMTLAVVPASTWLAERADSNSWVANWGGWLASLGHVPMVRWVTVTVDTAPATESALADTLAAAINPAAPSAARTILAQLAGAASAVTADVATRVSITFDPKASPAGPITLAEAVGEADRALAGLESALGSCGVAVLGRLDASQIAGVVRTAFDPGVRGEVHRLTAQEMTGDSAAPLEWREAGPFGAEEFADRYEHDGGVSVSFAWLEAPRQNVISDVLARLMMPGPYAKRVSVQYRPFPAAVATKVLEAEVNAASFRAHYRHRTGREETARDARDQARARQAAADEAAGAGVCLISLFVTVTVGDVSDLPGAIAWIEAAAGASKIRLRRMTCSQAVGFAVTLPCGICPAELARRLRH